MSTGSWRPLNEREAGSSAPEPVLLDGVPAHLERPLRAWLGDFLDKGQHAQRVALRLQLPAVGNWGIVQTLVGVDAGDLLRVVDAALYWQPIGMTWDELPKGRNLTYEQAREWQQNFADPVVALTLMLIDAGSVWGPAGAGRRLERRVDSTVHNAHTAATAAASTSGRPEAARDLTDAWAKVYGTHPDPSEAYRLAIRAVEDVAIPLTIPNDKNATLGKVRNHLTNAAAKWRLSMTSDVEPLIAMVSLLWTGQTDRHAGQVDLTRVDQKAAEQAVHLATTLVQWFAAGHVQRLP